MDDAIIEDLEAVSGGDEEGGNIAGENAYLDDSGVIEEREGVHYISEEVLNPDSQAAGNLNRDFKDLVDSIIK